MAKKKNSVALFEVIQKSRRSEMEVPKWMGGQDVAPAGAGEAGVGFERAARGPLAEGAEPLVSIRGDRLRLSLTYLHCAVAVVGLAALLVGGYALGWWSGARWSRPERADRTLIEKTPFGRHVLPGNKAAGGRTTQPTGAGPAREDGKWYLVVQALAGVTQADGEEAARIVEWCKARGEAATVARYTHSRTNKQRYIVWSLVPFDAGTSPEAKAYGRKIEELGKEYFAKYRTYDFRQQMATGKFDPWFEKYEKPR